MPRQHRLPIVPGTSATAATPSPAAGLWRIAQWAALAATVALAWGALARPVAVLPLFWNVVLPVLPLSFLVTPELWRGVCPVATLNMWSSRSGGVALSGVPSAAAGLPGILLLAALVPARHALLNGSGIAFVALLASLVAAATLLGRRHDAKAGFCNRWCPILPVERLYGQRPLVDVANPRCRTCTLCTPRGCLDLAGAKAVAQTLGPSRRDVSWLLTAFGGFAAAFPGFVAGYFTADATAPVVLVYAHILGSSVVSWAATTLAVLALRLRSEPVLAALATVAAGGYYWFAAPNAARAMGTGAGAGAVLRALVLVVVAAWGVRAVREASRGRGLRTR